MDNSGKQTLLSYKPSAPEQFEDELKSEPRGNCHPSSSQKSELQTSLHCSKEQKRRLQIRTSCQRLCDLLPFVSSHLDTATTLELTVNYISYLKEILPPDILSKVSRAVEMNTSSLWKNIQRSQKKRKTIRLKKNTSKKAKSTAKKSNADYVSRRTTEENIHVEVNQPSITITSPLTMDQTLPQSDGLTTVPAPPILLDKSTVPRGQMLPVYQDQFLSASFQFVENGWMNSATAFMNPNSCDLTSAGISHSLPQMGPNPSSSHMLWDATSCQVDPVAFPSGNFGQNYSPPEQTEVCYTDSPQVIPPDSLSVEHYANQLLITPSKFQSEPSSSDYLTLANGTQSVPEVLCDSRLFQDGDPCSSSPLTDSQCDVVSPFWLDFLLDSSGNICFPDPNLVDLVLSPETWSN